MQWIHVIAMGARKKRRQIVQLIMRLLLATRNEHKAREFFALLGAPQCCAWEPVTLSEFPDIPEVAEDGRTLEQNACKKAVQTALAAGLWTLGDDTGLEVKALGGAPGVLSARYAGPGGDAAANAAKLLRAMRDVDDSKRGALFRCIVALASPQGQTRIFEGRLEGRIAQEPAGTEGFGYDSVFFIPELGKTLAEISLEEKNRVSHRARAVAALLPALEQLHA